MTLVEVQRRMARAILGLSDACPDAAFIKPNARLTSAERLEIYRRSYQARVLGSLREDYPGLRAVFGERKFRALSLAYLAECPSNSFTLRNLGSRLEEWLRRNPAYAGGCPALALDMARLEWAHIVAFDGAEKKPLGPEDLLELNGDMSFGLQPYIALLELQYPVDDLRLRAEENRRRCRAPRPGHIFIAVHRIDLMVRCRRLAPDEFRILDAIRQGKSLGEAVDCAAGQSEIEEWFAAWSRLGWLCPPNGS